MSSRFLRVSSPSPAAGEAHDPSSDALADTGRDPAVHRVECSGPHNYLHALATDDVTATVMQSRDLSQWTPASVEPVSAVDGLDGTEQITVRLTDLPDGRFFLTLHWQVRP